MGAVVTPSSPDLDPAQRPADAPDPAVLARQARRLSAWARVVLVPVAIIGAVLSYQSLYKAAEPTFGPYLAAGFPLLVDLLILGASLQYVAGAKVGRPMTGWRLTAHCGVVATLFLNALASRNLGEVPWHVTAPAVWAVLVELTGKQVLGQWKAANFGPSASIPPSLWISAPIESFRTRLLMARTGVADAHQARIGLGTTAAAREALNLALPRRVNDRRDAKRVRRVVNRQMRAGSLPPQAVLGAVGWTDPHQQSERSPEKILRSVVHEILRPEETDTVVAAQPPVPVQTPAVPEAFGGERQVIVLPDDVPTPHNGAPHVPQVAEPREHGPAPVAPAAVALADAAAASNGSPTPNGVPVPAHTVAATHGAAGVDGSLPPVATNGSAVPVNPSIQPAAPAVPAAESFDAHVQNGANPVPAAATEQFTAPMSAEPDSSFSERQPEPEPTRPVQPQPAGASLWAAAQARTNGPDTAGIPTAPAPQASYAPAAGTPSSAGNPATHGWQPTAPLPQSTDTHLLDADQPFPDPNAHRQRSSENATETGSILISGRPTAKQKEERLDIAVRILNRNPDITGAELRAELEKEGWVVSDRTAARILGEARQIPPLRAVRY
ncbi:DUF2637 domain-containing protein [Kineosporia babensis]|uniref:DUF2637 domain-containing protein n=1 Tax=Kineosporia babensis TaxID=499548 RepID=A0A9X1NMN0_9ACTN|nr:DUF2637 domain-containing protein [Kineosporia babensis]MCD5315903.1 DUF2637 domain-containing protein [Kineosporia babensis]